MDRVQELDIQVIAACHSPVIPRSKIYDAFTLNRSIPHGDPPPQPSQPDLEALMHWLATGQQYVWQPPSSNGSSAMGKAIMPRPAPE